MWLKSAKISLKIKYFHVSIYSNLLLLHVQPHVRAEYHYNLQPTANISISCLFGVFTMSTFHIFKEIFRNPTSLFFRKDKLVDRSVIVELLENTRGFPKMFQ